MLATATDLPSEVFLPALEECLDSVAVLRACKEQLPRMDEEVRAGWKQARMIEALYHPQRYLRVVYVMLDDPTLPANRLWPEGQLVYLHTPVRKPMSRRGTLLTIHGVDVEAYSFPNDRRLRGLRTFTQRTASARIWQGWVSRSGTEGRMEVDSLQRLFVRYVPEQKWIVRLRAEWMEDSTGIRRKKRVAVRSASPSLCSTLLARHRSLVETRGEPSESFSIPTVVGSDIDRGLLAVEWMRGESLLRTLETVDPVEVLGGVARRLGVLHATPVTRLPRIDSRELNNRMLDAVSDLTLAHPPLASSLTLLARNLEASRETMEASPVASLHNDFHWNQLSIKRDRFALLDLERMGEGDPLLDVANFATQLQMLGHRPELPVSLETGQQWRDLFLEQWMQVDGQEMDDRRFRLYCALSRLELARGMMRHLRAGWRSLAEQCVELALADVSRKSIGDP